MTRVAAGKTYEGGLVELGDYARALGARWRTIVAGALLGVAIAAILTIFSPRSYLSGTTLLFGVQGGNSLTDLYQGSNMAALEVSSYAAVARSSSILEPVIRDVGLAESPGRLAQSITATVPPNTLVLRIECTREDPRESAAIANAVADQIQRRFSQLAPQTVDGAGTVKVTVLDRASIPAGPSSPVPQRNIAIGAFLGLALGFGVALVRESIDKTVRTREQLDELPPNLAPIAHLRAGSSGKRGKNTRSRNKAALPLALSVSSLRTGPTDPPAILFVTSSIPGEGKSSVALDLANALASRRQRVLLIDGDVTTDRGVRALTMRRSEGPRRKKGRHRAHGQEDHDIDVLDLDTALSQAGHMPSNPLAADLQDAYHDHYDFIVVDVPPLGFAATIFDYADGSDNVLLVIGLTKVTREQVLESYDLLTTAKLSVLGSVTTEPD